VLRGNSGEKLPGSGAFPCSGVLMVALSILCAWGALGWCGLCYTGRIRGFIRGWRAGLGICYTENKAKVFGGCADIAIDRILAGVVICYT